MTVTVVIALQLQLSAVINGTGAAIVSLPKTVVAQYKETNVTLKLPEWKLNIKKKRKFISIMFSVLAPTAFI